VRKTKGRGLHAVVSWKPAARQNKHPDDALEGPWTTRFSRSRSSIPEKAIHTRRTLKRTCVTNHRARVRTAVEMLGLDHHRRSQL
jgi:hypothetical protein